VFTQKAVVMENKAHKAACLHVTRALHWKIERC